MTRSIILRENRQLVWACFTNSADNFYVLSFLKYRMIGAFGLDYEYEIE